MTAPFLTPDAVAAMLFDRGVGLLDAGTDQSLALAIVDACLAEHHPAGRTSNDFEAIRRALWRLWGEAEQAGRRAECARYAVPVGRLQ